MLVADTDMKLQSRSMSLSHWFVPYCKVRCHPWISRRNKISPLTCHSLHWRATVSSMGIVPLFKNLCFTHCVSGIPWTGGAVEGVPWGSAAVDGPQTRRDEGSSLAQTDEGDRHRVRHESRHVHAAEHLRDGTQSLRRRHRRNTEHRHQGGCYWEGHQVRYLYYMLRLCHLYCSSCSRVADAAIGYYYNCYYC